MNLFEIFGSINVKNSDANKKIDETSKKAESLASKIGKNLDKAGKSITNVGKALAPLSAAAAGVLTASVKSASDFTDGMAKMSTLFDTTKTSLEELSNQFLQLSNKTGIASTELAEAGYQALSAGIDVDNSVGFVETAAGLAKAGFTSTATSVDVLTTAINAYGLKQEEAGAIANKLVRTQNLGKTTVDELASSMGKIIPTASSMGVNLDNLTAIYAQLTKGGLATAESTTYANSMLNELGKSSSIAGTALKESTGKSFQELMKDGKSVVDVLQILQKAADKSGVGLKEMFGSAEAGSAAVSLLKAGADEFNQTVEVMASDADTVGEALEKLETPSVKIKKAWNQIKNSGIQLGTTIMTAMLPTIEKIADKVDKATTYFSNLDDRSKRMVATILAVTAAASPVLVIGGKMVSMVSGGIKHISKISGLLSKLPTIFGAITSPVGLVIAGIAALVAAFVALYRHNEGFRQKVNDAWTKIKDKIGGVVESVSSLIQSVLPVLQSIFQNTLSTIKNLWDQYGANIVAALETAFDVIVSIVLGAFDLISGGIEIIKEVIAYLSNLDSVGSAWETFSQIASQAFSIISQSAQVLWQYLSTVIENIRVGWEALTSALSFLWENAIAGIQAIWQSFGPQIIAVLEATWQFIVARVEAVMQIIDAIIQTVGALISGDWSGVWQGIQQIFSAVWQGIQSIGTAGMNLLSSVVSLGLSVLSSIWSSIWSGIASVASNIWVGIKSSATNGIAFIKSIFTGGLNAALSIVTSILGKIKGKFQSIMDGAKNIVTNAINKIRSVFNFSWHLPHLSLPHISVKGGEAPFGIGGKGSLPSFSIAWYKKAMDNGIIMDQPTIFGYNPSSNEFLGGGEAGSETVVGTQSLMDMIDQAVKNAGAGSSNESAAILEVIYRWLRMGGLKSVLIDVLTNYVRFELDNREVARVVKKYA